MTVSRSAYAVNPMHWEMAKTFVLFRGDNIWSPLRTKPIFQYPTVIDPLTSSVIFPDEHLKSIYTSLYKLVEKSRPSYVLRDMYWGYVPPEYREKINQANEGKDPDALIDGINILILFIQNVHKGLLIYTDHARDIIVVEGRKMKDKETWTVMKFLEQLRRKSIVPYRLGQPWGVSVYFKKIDQDVPITDLQHIANL
jgi:hypothetical protein